MNFKLNPTIKEINKYLNQVVDELLEKHQKVSNPDFEKELQERTGIAWKQVKNYKNHPRPKQRIRDNAKILPFILECRKSDTKRRVYRSLLGGLVSTILVLCVFVVTKAVFFPKETIVVIHKTNMGKEISIGKISNATTFQVPMKDWILSVGIPTKEQIDLSQFTCKRTLLLMNSCRYYYNEANEHLEVHLLFQGKFLRGYTVFSSIYGGTFPRVLLSQLKEKPFYEKTKNKVENIAQGITRIYSETEGEEIDYMISKNGPDKSVNAVSITVAAKWFP